MARPRRLRWTTVVGLIFAGWYPGRNVWGRVQLPKGFEVFPEAERVLGRFGGLKFGDRNEHARLAPAAGEEEAGRIGECVRKLGRRLYPVGYYEHQDREYYLVDEAGIVYLLTGDTLHALASSFEKALDYIVWCRIRRGEVERDLGRLGLGDTRWQLEERT